MKREKFAVRCREEMACVKVSPQLRGRVVEAARARKEHREAKRLSAALALALMLLALGAAAIAAVSRAGMLDFAGRYGTVPDDAQTYVKTGILTLENQEIRAEIRELYYDGYVCRMTVDITPREPGIMLLGVDMLPGDRWQNMQPISRREPDERTAADVYASEGYQKVYAVNAWFDAEWGERGDRSGDYDLSEDGTLTLYCQEEYSAALPTRTGCFRLCLTPWQTPLKADSVLIPQESMLLEAPLELAQENAGNVVLVSTQAQEFASVGVRVDEIRVEQLPHEIRATITGTIVNRDRYEAMEGGLWFEFIDPELPDAAFHAQRLKPGMTGSGSSTCFGDQIIQTETLGREELHDAYTLRAFNCWKKVRYETCTFTMCEE